MRIIAGIARSVPLITPEGFETRPTSDKVKETLFNMLQGYIEGTTFLDLFAGSGQIGCEALSRGAKEAVFVDQGSDPINCIKHNVDKIKMSDKAKIMKMEALSALRTCEAEKLKIDVIFMDPPYGKLLEKGVLEYLSKSHLIDEDSLIIVEADKWTDFDYLDSLGFTVVKEKRYKNNKHEFIRKTA